MKYPLNVKADVQAFGTDGFMFYLTYGWRFADDMGIPSHVRAFDTIKEIREEAKHGVIACNCKECIDGLANDSSADCE
jgi:hypothetical protein